MPRRRLSLAIAAAACAACAWAAAFAAPPPAAFPPGFRLPDGATPLSYDLRLEVDPASAAFAGTVAIRVHLDAPSDRVWLHADELAIGSASWDGGALVRLPDTGDQMIALGFGRVVPVGEVTLSLAFTGAAKRDQEGVFRQQVDHRWYLFTQGEPMFARRIAPCFDEPRWKTPWRVKLVVPAAAVALANTPVASDRPLPDGRREVAFAETPPMPAYLLAFAVGPFELVDGGAVGKHHVPLRVAMLAGERGLARAAVRETPKIVDALEAYLGDALPLAKLDLVAVPHLFGAMENPGLVTFDRRLLAGDPGRADFVAELVHVAAHELAHQWFGDLVTPAWWDDLWLAEAFASWLGERTVDTLGRSADSALAQALARRRAIDVDGQPGALPLARHVTRDDDPLAGYDAIAYDKAQQVLATFERWIGDEPWRAAARAYLAAHRGGTAVAADFVEALARASSRDNADALYANIVHSGVPIVDARLACSGAPTLIVRARDAAVPVCIAIPDAAAPICALATAARDATVPLPGASCPAWVRPTGGYYVLAWFGGRPLDPPLSLLAPPEQVALGEDVDAAARRGVPDFAAATAEIAELAQWDVAPASSAVSIAAAIDPFVADADRPAWTRWLAERFRARLEARGVFPSDEAGFELAETLVPLVGGKLLASAIAARAHVELASDLSPAHVVPRRAAIAAATETRADYDALIKVARAQEPDVGDAADALAAFGSGFAAAAIDTAASPAAPADLRVALARAFLGRGATRAAAWAALRPRLDTVIARLSRGDGARVLDAAGGLCEPDARAELAAAAAPLVERVDGGRAHLAAALAQIDRCVAARARAGSLAGALH